MAGSVISLGIEVSGESTFKSALTAIDAQIKAMDAGVQAAAASMDTMGKSEESAAAKMNALGGSLAANQQKLQLLGQQYENAKARLAQLAAEMEKAKNAGDPAAIDRATNAYNRQSAEVSKLQAQMSRTETAIAKTQQEMKKTGDAAKQAQNPIAQITEKLKALKDSNVGQALEKAASGFAKFSAAAVAAGTAIAGAVTQASKKIFDLTKSVGTYADTVLTLSSTSNVDPIDLQKWEYASQFIDVSVDTLTGSMTRLTKNMTSESAATTAAFSQLGISVRDSNGNLKTAQEVMFEVVDALGQVDNQTERDALAMTLLGKSASELNPLIQSGSAAFKQLGNDAQNAGLIMSSETLNAFGQLDDQMNVMKSTLGAASNSIAAMFLPAVQQIVGSTPEVVQAFLGMAQGAEGSRERFASAISNLVSRALALINEMLPKLLQLGTQIIQSLVQGIMKNISQISTTIQTVITSLLNTIIQNLPQILAAGVDILIAVINGIIQAIPQLVASLPQIISAIVQGLARLAPELLKAGVAIVQGVWQGIASAAKWLMDQVTGFFGGIVSGVKRMFGIHSPSTLMAEEIGRPMAEGVAVGITENAGLVQRAFDMLIPDGSRFALGADNYSVAARTIGGSGGGGSVYQDNRPIILKLNDRELGRAVRGYAYAGT